MKDIIYALGVFASFLVLTGCGLDNYDEPGSNLYGQITYEGEPIGLKGTGEAVQLQLYQDGYELDAPIPVYVKQDGSFEAALFDGEYKLVTRDQNGPWINTRDTTIITVDGNAEVQLEVTPYFVPSQVSITLTGKSLLQSTFTVQQVVNDSEVDYAMLLISKTNFVDDVVYLGRQDVRDLEIGIPIHIDLDVSDIKEVQADNPLFARIGIRAVGADQAIYSEVVRVR